MSTITRRTEAELDLYFGGRDAYIKSLEGAIAALEKQIADGVHQDVFSDFFEPRTEESVRNNIALLRETIALNK